MLAFQKQVDDIVEWDCVPPNNLCPPMFIRKGNFLDKMLAQ